MPGGNGRKNILRAVEGSLQRLDTDYIDVYMLHTWDQVTPAEEVMRTLDDLVRSGKVRYVALSDAPAWYVAQAQTLAQERHWEPISTVQLEYSLAERNIEFEYTALAQQLGTSIMVWSPLASGCSRASTAPLRTAVKDPVVWPCWPTAAIPLSTSSPERTGRSSLS
jgi:aryl-alcohol dehydrogenase-like predicted oxidoreductase